MSALSIESPTKECATPAKETPAPRSFLRWVREDDLPLLTSKFARILELAAGRDVLDVGCVGGRNERIEDSSHARLASVSRHCVGIDIVAEEVYRRNEAGYDMEVANAEDFHLARKFDVIVAADLIEHLANPGRFLERAHEHLRPSGVLCLVTPNALSLNNALKGLAGLRVDVNPEHTCWFDRQTIRELLARAGFFVAEEYWQDYQKHPLTAIALHFRRNLAAHLIVIARPKSSETPK